MASQRGGADHTTTPNASTRRQVRRCQTGEKLRPRAPTVGTIVAAWTLRHRAVDGLVVGFRCSDQIDLTLAGAKLEPSGEDLAQIKGGAR